MKVTVDPERCVGHGRCYDLVPEIFGEDDEGHCVILKAEVPKELEAKARLGAGSCPEQAIKIIEEAGAEAASRR